MLTTAYRTFVFFLSILSNQDIKFKCKPSTLVMLLKDKGDGAKTSN